MAQFASFFFTSYMWRIPNWKYCWRKELPYSLVYRLSWLHSASVWQVQSAGCVIGTSATGSKWRLQLILCSCASVAWDPCTRKRNVRIENPIFRPNSVWTTLSLLLSAHNWLLRNECIAYISSSPWEISQDSILKMHLNQLTLVKIFKHSLWTICSYLGASWSNPWLGVIRTSVFPPSSPTVTAIV